MITYQLTVSDYVAAQRLHSRRTAYLTAAIIFVGCVAAIVGQI